MKRRLVTMLAGLIALLVVGAGFGCASSGGSSGSSDVYHRQGSIHRDSFPGAYGGARYGGYGRYGRY